MTDQQTIPLGQRIAHRRRALCLTQTDLAALVGVAQPTLSLWETGANTPSLHHRPRLSEALGVPVADLFTEDVA